MLPTIFTRRRSPWNEFWPSACSPVDQVLNLVEKSAGSPLVRAFDVDLREDESGYVLQADVPGLSQDQIDVTVEDGVVRITASDQSDREEKREGYHLRERRSGTVSRSFRLPDDVNPDGINADLRHGVLTVTLPKSEAAKPKTIKVEVN